ncbi:carbamoyltransferase C-terminal domain-containing protein, partial [Staphylococcus agnetis]
MITITKPIYILGTGLSHDGSSCLMKNGKIVVAIEKERLSKIKHDGFNDNDTIQYCLDYAGITIQDIDLIVEESTLNTKYKSEDLIRIGSRKIPDYIPKVKISHHLAHAYSVIGPSPFQEMGVVVMDGQGSSLDDCKDITSDSLPKEFKNLSKNSQKDFWEKESYYIYKDNTLIPIIRDFSRFIIRDFKKFPIAPNDMDNSVAELYGGMSRYVFNAQFSEGKLMGLAPYGNKDAYKKNLFKCSNGRVFINYDSIKSINYFKGGKFNNLKDNFQYFADLARWMQEESERAVIYLFNSYYQSYPIDNVGYAGGLALNSVINGKLKKSTPFKNFYFQPAANDSGLSIGCCYYGWLEVLKNKKTEFSQKNNFGKIYNEKEILDCLNKFSSKITFKKIDNVEFETASLLSEGKVIALFNGSSEFGPRALGNRSILADPRINGMDDYINKEIKNREDFRPFAPSVLEEDLNEYFILDYLKSPHMLLVGLVKEKYREQLPAITHIDGTA